MKSTFNKIGMYLVVLGLCLGLGARYAHAIDDLDHGTGATTQSGSAGGAGPHAMTTRKTQMPIQFGVGMVQMVSPPTLKTAIQAQMVASGFTNIQQLNLNPVDNRLTGTATTKSGENITINAQVYVDGANVSIPRLNDIY